MAARPSAGVRTGEVAAWALVRATADVAGRIIGEDRLASVYAIGSLAHGGFSPAVSDVDVALLTHGERPTQPDADAILHEMRAGTQELAERLSLFHVPWAQFSRPPAGTRFPAIDRLDLVRHGVLVTGADLRERWASAPHEGEIRDEAIAFALSALDPRATAAFDAVTDVHDTTKIVLMPVRLWHAVDAGSVTNNDDAVAHYLATDGVRSGELVSAALRWRHEGALPDPAVTSALLAEHLMALHIEVLARVAATPAAERHPQVRPLLAAYRGAA